jgi:AraC-like DNA-binding protein
MEQNVNRPLQVAALAAQARLSPSHFFALFKRHTGCPPMDYFTRLRMRRACRLLASTSASVKEAAAALGYDDPFYFSRVFKAVNKVAPSVYRRSARAAHAASDQNQMATGLFAGTEMPPPGSGHAGISRTLKTSGQRRKQFEQTTFAAKNPVKTVGAIRQMAYCLRQSQPAKC